MLFRLFQWVYFRATGEIWSPSMLALLWRPTLRWVWSGSSRDMGGPTLADMMAEAFAVAMRDAELRRGDA